MTIKIEDNISDIVAISLVKEVREWDGKFYFEKMEE